MTETFTTRFDRNGSMIDAEYLYFGSTGRFTVHVDGLEVVEIDWVDWSAELATSEGLRRRALSEIETILAAAAAGDIDEPPPVMLAALRKAAGSK